MGVLAADGMLTPVPAARGRHLLESDLLNRILISAVFALASSASLPAAAQNLPSGSMLGPSAGRVPSNMALKWVFRVEVESVDQAAIDQVQEMFSRNGFHFESTKVSMNDLPTLWKIEGTKEYAVRSTKADAILAEVKKAIASDTGKFSWTVTPKLAPKKR